MCSPDSVSRDLTFVRVSLPNSLPGSHIGCGPIVLSYHCLGILLTFGNAFELQLLRWCYISNITTVPPMTLPRLTTLVNMWVTPYPFAAPAWIIQPHTWIQCVFFSRKEYFSFTSHTSSIHALHPTQLFDRTSNSFDAGRHGCLCFHWSQFAETTTTQSINALVL